MCFSATASFISGGILTATGVLTIRQAKKKSEIPFASIPLFFGMQQIIEGAIWISFTSPLLNTTLTNIYSVFSNVLWPIFVPTSLLLLEGNTKRRKILMVFVIIGLIIGLYLFYFILKEPVVSRIVNNSIAYNLNPFSPLLTLILYSLATIISCLFSSHKSINLFGIMLGISFFGSYWLYNATFFSVWCFFAALLSLLVYVYFRYRL